MKILVICQGYPSSQNPTIMAFAHARNINYRKLGHDVEVLSFATKSAYDRDGIRVFPESELNQRVGDFDVWVMHMPNIRNHLRWLILHRKRLKQLVMIIHGHEFIAWESCVEQDFPFQKSWNRSMRRMIGRSYDWLKLKVWSKFFHTALGRRARLIFISDFILKEAEKFVGISFSEAGVQHQVIHNPINPIFENFRYSPLHRFEADFVTIRPFDEPKYGVDIVCELARRNPEYTFHIYGVGDYFKYYKPPHNVKVIEGFFSADELPEVLNQYRCALLPTRWDSQGVLMCEIAVFGMPLLVSNIEICRQMVGNYPNVRFFSNLDFDQKIEIPEANGRLLPPKFLGRELALKEVQFFANAE